MAIEFLYDKYSRGDDEFPGEGRDQLIERIHNQRNLIDRMVQERGTEREKLLVEAYENTQQMYERLEMKYLALKEQVEELEADLELANAEAEAASESEARAIARRQDVESRLVGYKNRYLHQAKQFGMLMRAGEALFEEAKIYGLSGQPWAEVIKEIKA